MTTEQSIIENNKVIAEFMGVEKHLINANGERWAFKNFKYNRYHTDWSLLMPVVEKIESLNEVCDFNINYCSVYGNEVHVSNLFKNTFQPYTEKAETKIEAVYNACLKFIQYYK